MKRISFFLFFLFSITLQLKSQDLHFGVKGGLNLSTFTGNTVRDNNPRLAYHLGGFSHIALSERFSLNPELLYLSIGSRFNSTFRGVITSVEDIEVKSVSRMNYLAVPVNARFNFTDAFGVDFGPQVSFLINSVSKVIETNIEDESFDDSNKTSGDFEPDFGLNLGLTYKAMEKVNIQLRYYQGLKNLFNDSLFDDDTRHNIALQISVGYILF